MSTKDWHTTSLSTSACPSRAMHSALYRTFSMIIWADERQAKSQHDLRFRRLRYSLAWPTLRAAHPYRDECQFSIDSPLKRRKSFAFAVTTTRSLTLAIAAIWPSANEGGRPRFSSRARSTPCHSAA